MSEREKRRGEHSFARQRVMISAVCYVDNFSESVEPWMLPLCHRMPNQAGNKGGFSVTLSYRHKQQTAVIVTPAAWMLLLHAPIQCHTCVYAQVNKTPIDELTRTQACDTDTTGSERQRTPGRAAQMHPFCSIRAKIRGLAFANVSLQESTLSPFHPLGWRACGLF